VLFVMLAPGYALTTELNARLRAVIRDQLSPRHAPDRVISVPEIPYTLTGKKCEVPVRRILEGWPPQDVGSDGALRTPGLLEQFAIYRRRA
jgi:acetoacetyl-CoA synthetase